MIFNKALRYNQEAHLLNTYDALAACRSINAVDQALGDLLNNNLLAAKNCIWSLFHNDVDFDAEFGRDIVRQQPLINETFIQRLTGHYTACSTALCNIIERSFPSEKEFKAAIAKHQIAKTNTNLALTAFKKILLWPDHSIERIQNILQQETRIARYASKISLLVTKPLTVLLDLIGKELRQRQKADSQ
ncbi:hypothetical protein FJ364_00110 [Candidatus Dependentiae bacterium]|nr:hypothetical protein [Candidatus Dependentiae bacterium]